MSTHSEPATHLTGEYLAQETAVRRSAPTRESPDGGYIVTVDEEPTNPSRSATSSIS